MRNKDNMSRVMKNARYYRIVLGDPVKLRNLAKLCADCEPKMIHVSTYFTSKGSVNVDKPGLRLRMTMADFDALKRGVDLIDLNSRLKKYWALAE